MTTRHDLVIQGPIFDWDAAKEAALTLAYEDTYAHVAIAKGPKKLRRPNACCVYASDDLDLLMAFMPGKPLAEWLEGEATS